MSDDIAYRFEDLDERGKDAVREWLYHDEWFRQHEYFDTLKALVKHFGARLRNYSIDWTGCCSYSTVEFDTPDYDPENPDDMAYLEKEVRELGDGSGNCVLTGVCTDECAVDGIREAWADGERDLKELLEAGFRSLLKCSEKDWEYDNSDEAIQETCDSNDYYFNEDGSVYDGDDPETKTLAARRRMDEQILGGFKRRFGKKP